MQDSTVSGLRANDAAANTRGKFSGGAIDRYEEDELLARVLVISWSLTTGRILRDGVAPQSLTEDELISFWADDQIGLASHAGTG